MRLQGQNLSNLKTALTTFPLEYDEIITFIENSDSTILTSDDLTFLNYYYDGDILKSNMQVLVIEAYREIPKNTIINYKRKIWTNATHTTYELVNYGNFNVIEIEKKEDTNTYKMTCYDDMIKSMVDYVTPPLLTYPVQIGDYFEAICNYLGIEIQSKIFTNSTKVIQNELYENLGYKFRDVFDEISKTAGSSICINLSNKAEVKTINNTNDTINEEFLNENNITIKEKFGPINSIVLSRSAESDNVYIKDDESIAQYGLCEIKIVDNQIMNFNDRSEYLQGIANNLFGLTFYETKFSSSPQGIMYYEFLDKFNLSIGENTYPCIMTSDDCLNSMGISENIETKIPNTTETNYSYASETDKKINQAYIIVNKAAASIEEKVSQDEIIAALNLAIEDGQGIVNIKGNNFILDSDNAKIDKYGNVEFEDARFRGGNILLEDDGTEEGASLKIQTPSRYTEEIVVGDVLQNKRILFNLKNFTYNQIANMCTPLIPISNYLGFEAYISRATQQKPYDEIMWFTINEDENNNQYFSMWIFHNGNVIEEINRIKFVDGKIEDNFVFEVPNNYFGAISRISSSNDVMNNLSLLTYEVVRETNVSGNGLIADIKADYDFTSSDATRVEQILEGTIQPTPMDYKKYDLNKDGVISLLDYVKILKYINANIGITNPGKIIINTQDIEDNIVLLDGAGNEKLSIGLIGGIKLDGTSIKNIFAISPIARTIGLNSNTNYTISTTYSHTLVKCNVEITNLNGTNKLPYSITNGYIVIGEGVNHIRVSGNVMMRGIVGAALIGEIAKVTGNTTTIISSAYGTATKDTGQWVSVGLTPKTIDVSQNDRIEITISCGATGTITVAGGTGQFTYLHVDVVD